MKQLWSSESHSHTCMPVTNLACLCVCVACLCCMSVCLCCTSVLHVYVSVLSVIHATSCTLWLHPVMTNCMGAGYWAAWLLCLFAGISSRYSMLSGAPSHGSWGTLTLANPQMIFFMVSIPRWQLLVLACPVLCPRALFFEQRMNGAVL